MVLLDRNRLYRILKRMAYQTIEKSKGENLDMIGLNERGYAVAEVMKKYITDDSSCSVNLTRLSIAGQEPVDSAFRTNPKLVIVDDVIFSGRTMYKALSQIPELLSYEDVFVTSVIDRGHRKLPVEAGIVGVTVPTKRNEHVDFQLKAMKPEQILLIKK